MKHVKGKITITPEEQQKIFDESKSLDEFIYKIAELIYSRTEDYIVRKIVIENLEEIKQ